jgi:hypothetical protein
MELSGKPYDPAIFPRGKTPVPFEKEAEWDTRPVWKSLEKRKYVAPAGIVTPDRPTRS